ncbi:MAG TPA: bifunctional phosphoribosylaminoimidazolecarboxamide formyltransferase/IMP cyclohydrolase, partial [Candidatus Limnocylindria bacterium]|nr:bifunctional phosphoribosylaminoimidazolecarboxamide formyltransferase/IMP cyclohydrolase [Candidatus Limnocylindria bacterium]
MNKNDKNLKSRTALLSVYNKSGIEQFAKELVDLGFKILASGGTAKALVDAGLEVQDIALLVGGGAILGHRVVTLSREIHAGLLARDVPEDRKELEDLKIPFIDLVCVDLYP